MACTRGQQFREGEGLNQVIVAPGLQTFHPVIQPGHGGEEQRRRVVGLGAQVAHQAQAVQAGQHAVDN
jgi:hypothetical protein